MMPNHVITFAATLAVTTAVVLAAPLGTGVTYQGLLTDGGAPLTGAVDLQFRLYDAETGGVELGVVTIDDLAVSNGRVTAQLDFGGHFGADARWLQIEVRDGASPGGYDVLPVRQRLLATPMGLYAGMATTADTATHAIHAADVSTLDGLNGDHYRAFANLTGVPGGLADGDDDALELLSCVAGEMPAWNGSVWRCNPDDLAVFARTVAVGPVGDPSANGSSLMAAVASLPVPSTREEGWLVEIEPGLYDLGSSSLVLPPWVVLTGSGELFTVVTSSVCGGLTGTIATIVGNDHVEIRDLTVENTCADGALRSHGVSFGWSDIAGRLTRVTAQTTGAAGGCRAVYNRSEQSVLDRVTAKVTGCAGQADALLTVGQDALLTDCSASAEGSGKNNGLHIASRTYLSRGFFTAADTAGEDDAAVLLDGTADLSAVDAGCPDAAVRITTSHNYTITLSRLITNGPVVVEDQGSPLALVIEHSRIVASGPTVIGDTGAAIGIGMTQLAGGPVSASGAALRCAGIWDELWQPYATTCP